MTGEDKDDADKKEEEEEDSDEDAIPDQVTPTKCEDKHR